MPGIDLEDIMVGISVCRNQDLANVFYRLHLIEAYGTGMGKIMKAYEGMVEKPVIETTKNAFKIILPNINAKYEKGAESVLPAEPSAHTPVGTPLSAGEEKVLEYARTHGAVTRNEVMGLLEVSISTAARVLKKLVKSNLLDVYKRQCLTSEPCPGRCNSCMRLTEHKKAARMGRRIACVGMRSDVAVSSRNRHKTDTGRCV